MNNSKNYQELLTEKFGERIVINQEKPYEIYTDSDNILPVMDFLKNQDLNFLADISSADYKEYFEVVYQLFSFNNSDHMTVKIKLNYDLPKVNSVTHLWETANWLEREVYDLMGITFINHPNLERILTWEGFEGHPLRKDYISKSGRK